MKKNKGFTLIELLVVIAIIGILATIVLLSIGGVQTSAKDAAIKANVTQIPAAAGVFYNSNSYSYTGFAADASVTKTAAAVTSSGSTLVTNVSATAYASCAQLIGTNTTAWCVDSTGTSAVKTMTCTVAAFTATVCP
jgi:type IV pilus assembly protein PilA